MLSFALIFWLLMFLWLVFGIISNWPGSTWVGSYGPIYNSLFLFVLFLLLGWKVFGAPIHV